MAYLLVETNIERRRAGPGPKAYPERRSLFTRAEKRHPTRHPGSRDPEMAYPGELTELETTDGEATAGARGPRGPRAYPSRTHRVRPTPIEPNPKGQGLPREA